MQNQNQKYSILADNDALHLMCIHPCEKCSLIKTFHDIENVSATETRTQDNILVIKLSLKGKEEEKKALAPTLREMTRQMCQMCQKNR